MIRCRESKISAHHNYLVNDMLTPGFVVGNPDAEKGFYFVAHVVGPGETAPRISARIPDDRGSVLLEMDGDRLGENRGGFNFQANPDGFCIQHPSGGPLFEVYTHRFARGHLTVIKGRLVDEKGRVRMEPLGESIQVHGESELTLESPFAFSR